MLALLCACLLGGAVAQAASTATAMALANSGVGTGVATAFLVSGEEVGDCLADSGLRC